jgi:hypothetical protein
MEKELPIQFLINYKNNRDSTDKNSPYSFPTHNWPLLTKEQVQQVLNQAFPDGVYHDKNTYSNIAFRLQYIQFCQLIQEEVYMPQSIRGAFLNTMLIQIASCTEGLFHLRQYADTPNLNEEKINKKSTKKNIEHFHEVFANSESKDYKENLQKLFAWRNTVHPQKTDNSDADCEKPFIESTDYFTTDVQIKLAFATLAQTITLMIPNIHLEDTPLSFLIQ